MTPFTLQSPFDEARAECDRLKEELALQESRWVERERELLAQVQGAEQNLATAERERDEAKQRFNEQFAYVTDLIRERDEAREEVERFKAALIAALRGRDEFEGMLRVSQQVLADVRDKASRYEAALRAGIEMAEVVMEQAKLTPPSGSSQIEWERRIDDVEEWLFAADAAAYAARKSRLKECAEIVRRMIP